MKRLCTLVLAAATIFIGSGCEAMEDAEVANRDTGPADVIVNMPDGFSNVAAKCEGPNRIYVIYHGKASEGGAKAYGALAVVPNDPRCLQ